MPVVDRIPDAVFRGKFRCGQVEFGLLVIILNETCRPGAQEWTRISDEDLADWSGLTHPSLLDFRRRLAKRGLIDWRPVYGVANGSSEYAPGVVLLGLVESGAAASPAGAVA